jgi:hypothetical protein
MGEDSYDVFQRAIDVLVHHKLQTDDEAAEVFGEEPLVDEVRFVSFATEKGEKYHKAHFNLQVDIWHYVQFYSIHKLRKRMKEWLKKMYKPERNWNVFVSLMNEKRTNYANKEERQKAYAKFKVRPELKAELARLSANPRKHQRRPEPAETEESDEDKDMEELTKSLVDNLDLD